MSDAFVNDVKQVYLNGEYRILTALARQVIAGVGSDNWLQLKEAEVHVFNQYLLNESELIRQEYTKLLPELREAYFTEAQNTFSEISKFKNLRRGINAIRNDTVLGLSPVSTLMEKATNTLESTIFRMIRAAEDAYRTVIYRASADSMVGDITRRQAARNALQGFAEQGITGFVDKAGRNWELGSYVEMSMRATIRQTETQARVNSMVAEGMNLFIVSVHAENCQLCNPWENQVLCIKAEEGYPTVSEAISQGLFHPNCKHTLNVYFKGITRPAKPLYDKETNAKRYEFTQKQRYNERQIRKYKRLESVSAGKDKEKYKAKVKQWQSHNAQFVKENDLTRDRKREQIKTMVR